MLGRSPECVRKSSERRRKHKTGACFAWNDGRCTRAHFSMYALNVLGTIGEQHAERMVLRQTKKK